MLTSVMNHSLREDLRRVILLNVAYFAIEFAVAVAIGSVALFADSIDFLEDSALNLLVLIALGWSGLARARLGMVLAALLLLPGVATIWTAWQQFGAPVGPDPVLLTATGIGALAVNLGCALLLARHRAGGGSLPRAAFLSARNDVAANAAIIIVGLVTAFVWHSPWPDLLVGLGIAALNAGAAFEVFTAARAEHREARA
jgi:Co/Zn/Cd efflux system component